MEHLKKFIATKINEYYIYVDEDYRFCEALKPWFDKMAKN